MFDSETTTYLCDKCQKEVLYRDLEVKVGMTIKYCRECYNNRDTTLTPNQHTLLIWLYDAQMPDLGKERHLEWMHVDQGNLINAYGEITGGNPSDALKRFLADMQALLINKFIRTHTLDAYYTITPEGINYLENSNPEFTVYQCCQCGDFWSNEEPDEMILEALMTQNPNSTTIEATCQACETQNEREADLYGDDEDDNTWENVLVYGE